jgi:hypothetical protein
MNIMNEETDRKEVVDSGFAQLSLKSSDSFSVVLVVLIVEKERWNLCGRE